MQSTQTRDNVFFISFCISYSPSNILSIITLFEFPLKGNSPKSIKNKITPIDHTSIAGVNYFNLPYKTSGAIYFKLPASIFSTLNFDATPAIPKSTTFSHYLILYIYKKLLKKEINK